MIFVIKYRTLGLLGVCGVAVISQDYHTQSLPGSAHHCFLFGIHVGLNRIKLINISDFIEYFKKSMTARTTIVKKLAYLGAAISQGQPIGGVQKGPRLIRQSGAFKMLQKNYGAEIVDYGDIKVENQKSLHPPVDFAVRNLNVLGPLLGRLHNKVASIAEKKSEDILLTVGGDHSIGAATVTGMKKVHPNLKVVWVDAHPDCTDSRARTPTKMHNENYHGMPLSHITGMTTIPKLPYWSWLQDQPLLDPRNVVLIGIRDIDKDQYVTLKKYGVKCFTMDHIDKYGIGDVMTQTIKYLDPNNQHPFHLSFDVDGIDPSVVGQTGTLFRYGLSGRESVHIVRRLVHETRLVGMDLVEINEDFSKGEPKRVPYRGEAEIGDVTQTVGMGIDLISSLFTRYFEL